MERWAVIGRLREQSAPMVRLSVCGLDSVLVPVIVVPLRRRWALRWALNYVRLSL